MQNTLSIETDTIVVPDTVGVERDIHFRRILWGQGKGQKALYLLLRIRFGRDQQTEDLI